MQQYYLIPVFLCVCQMFYNIIIIIIGLFYKILNCPSVDY